MFDAPGTQIKDLLHGNFYVVSGATCSAHGHDSVSNPTVAQNHFDVITWECQTSNDIN